MQGWADVIAWASEARCTNMLAAARGSCRTARPCHTASAATRPPLPHCRPDRQRWRPFPALSGGQQALATLALCFALQAGLLYCLDLECVDGLAVRGSTTVELGHAAVCCQHHCMCCR